MDWKAIWKEFDAWYEKKTWMGTPSWRQQKNQIMKLVDARLASQKRKSKR